MDSSSFPPFLAPTRTSADARASGRDFSDSGGTVWRVYEQPPLGQQRMSSLIFESSTALRRVKNYPSDWRSLSAEALESLSWGR
jgi:hypothetical protein